VQVVGGALRMGGGREDRPKISESPAALGKDTQFPKQMNGGVSRARLGINRWLARDPLFGYYFAPVWGTIALTARPRKAAVFLRSDS
jgi:hypothetical protein